MRRIYSLLTLIVALMFSGNAMAAEVLTFPDYNDKANSSYTDSWTATVDGKTWTLSGFNNNNNGWAFVKCGSKNTATTSTIISPAFDAAVTDVVFTVDNTGNVTSATLDVLNGEEVVQTIDLTMQWEKGEVDAKVEGAAGYSYKLTLENSQAVANGPTWISKVALYTDGEYEAPAPALTAVDDKVWNFSEFELGDIEESKVIDNLEVNAASGKKVTIDENEKSMDDFTFTQRLKFNGTGAVDTRNVRFKVKPNVKITVYGMSGGSAERTMNLDIPYGNTVGTLVNDGTAIGKVEYTYEGENDANVYVYSTNSGFNIYGIVVSPVSNSYKVTCLDAENGSVSADTEEAMEGATVTISVSPSEGYVIESVTVVDDAGTPVEVAEDNTFVMPASDVTVSATFKEKVKNEPGVFADTPLSKDLYKTWDGFDDYAKPTNQTPAWDEYVYGTTVEGGAVIYGNGSVLNSTYADITGTTTIRFTGTPGLRLRILLNRQADNSNKEENPVIGEDGTVDFYIGSYDYIHVNAIKVGWGASGAVESIILNPSDAEERVKNEPGVYADTPLTKDMFKSWDGYDDYAKPTDAQPAWDDYTYGTTVDGGAVIYGNGSVLNSTYADITGATVIRFTGTPNLPLRVMMNRQADNTYKEENPVIGEDGTVDLDISSYEYVHVNAIKVGWGASGAVESIILNPSEEPTLPEAPEIINPSFELAAADTPLTEDLKASNGPLTIYGWTEEVNTSFNNTEILKSGNTASSQFGSSEASDGEYALFFRHGWNESGTTNTFTSAALATLPAGNYRLSVDYKQHYSHDGNPNNKTTVGIAMMNGETALGSATSDPAAGVQGNSGDPTYFTDNAWSTLEALFTVEEAVEGATVVISLNAAGQRRSDFFIDNVKLESVSEEELAKGELEEEIEKAKAELEKYPAGENLFQYAEDELKPMNDAIEAAETALNDEAATAESLKAALESLKAAEETFAPEQTEPVDGQAYTLSLTTSEGTFQLNIEGTANTIAVEGTPVYLVKQEDGTYAITPDNENYVVYAGGNNWTMSTSTTPYGFTFAALADGGYSITGKNGFYGTNKGGGDAAGSTVYGDKNTGNGNYIWNIAEAEDDKDPNDMTDLIVNPAYLHEGDDGTADYAGWTWSPVPGESGWKYRDFDEPMNLVTYSGNVNFSFEQTIPEVPAGQYRLSVYGFYRAGSAQDEADRVANGDVTHNLQMFAEVGDEIYTQPIMNLYEGATSEDVTGKNNHCVVNGYTDLFVPDGASDSRDFFIAGYYRNDLIVNITEAGEMKIGINHPTGMTYDSDYAPIGAWELYRIGDAEEEVTLLGDVNKDNKISIVDATMTVEFALEKATPTAYQRKAADYDENQEIDVVDAALILQAVMNFDYDASGTKAREYVSNDYLVVNGNSIALENNDTYVAFQMDITVDGEFNGVELSARAADHHIAYNQIGENKYRVIVLSNSNSAFSGNAGELINLNVNGTYELSNIRFVDSEIRPVYIGVDNTATGIGSVRALEAGAEGIYTLGGVKVNALQKGVNIVRKADGTTVKVLVK